MSDITKSTTARGFMLITFKDRNDIECTIQKSSLAGEDAIWFGAADIGVQRHARDYQGWHKVDLKEIFPGQDIVANNRMHLTRERVIELLPILQYFAENGELPE